MKKTYMNSRHYIAAAALLISSSAWAGALTVPNTFSAGTPAVAAQVNANFTAAKTAVDDNNVRINTNAASAATNATGIATNATAISTLQNAGLVRTINVSPVIGGGGVVDPIASGTALINAVAAITGSSSITDQFTNQFTVKLEPGIYDLGTQMLLLPDGVNLEGSGQDITMITSATPIAATEPRNATVIAEGGTSIRNISIENNRLAITNNDDIAALKVNWGLVLVTNSRLRAVIPILGDSSATSKTIVSYSYLEVIPLPIGIYRIYFSFSSPNDVLEMSFTRYDNPLSRPGAGVVRCFSNYLADFTAAPAGCL